MSSKTCKIFTTLNQFWTTNQKLIPGKNMSSKTVLLDCVDKICGKFHYWNLPPLFNEYLQKNNVILPRKWVPDFAAYRWNSQKKIPKFHYWNFRKVKNRHVNFRFQVETIPFLSIFGHFWSIFGHFGRFWDYFGRFLAFWSIFEMAKNLPKSPKIVCLGPGNIQLSHF